MPILADSLYGKQQLVFSFERQKKLQIEWRREAAVSADSASRFFSLFMNPVTGEKMSSKHRYQKIWKQCSKF